jgi:protein disulfide-isomerase A6
MNKSNKMPLLWSTLGNKYGGDILFYSHRDRKGKGSVKLGFEAGESGKPKVLVYGPGETQPIMFEGVMKLEPLSKFFDSILDGTADLKAANTEAAKDSETFVQDETEAEIERQQEAEMLKLAHGGYAEFIDFEQAVKEGHGKDFHKVHGYAGAMGGLPKKKPAGEGAGADTADEGAGAGEEKKEAEAEAETETKKSSTKTKGKSKMPATNEAGQIVMEAREEATATETGQPQTPEPSVHVPKDEL